MGDSVTLTETLTFCLIAYLLGSLSSAIIVSKIFGLTDPRKVGSGNPGATNVLRYAGKKIAVLTLAGDAFKGIAPIKISLFFGVSQEVGAIVGCFAFLGHLFPIFHSFKGGKGVATFLGVTSALYWQIGACFLMSWIFIALVTRYSSLSALLSSLIVVALIWEFSQSANMVSCFALMAAFIYVKHNKNIVNLFQGKEKKIGDDS